MFLSRIVILLMAIATVGSAGALWAKPPTKPQSTTTTQTTSSACGALSKKQAAGDRGTPSSPCVVGAAQLKRDQQKPHS